MKGIILFRFHKEIEVCENRLESLKKMNPNSDIFGLYGGEDILSTKVLNKYIRSTYELEYKKKWNWKHGDLAISDWYKNFGYRINFDRVYIVEWDLIYLESLKNTFKDIGDKSIGITALSKLKNIEKKWYWTNQTDFNQELQLLKIYLKEYLNYKGPIYASQGPGTLLTKDFLDNYSKLKVPELCHDEVRLPTIAAALGYRLENTKFQNKWFCEEESRVFNCNKLEISLSKISDEYKLKYGRRVFHPYYSKIDINHFFC